MERIFELAEKHGWLDDFGRWNFKDDGLISFACSMVREHTPDHVKQITKPWVGLTDEEIASLVEDEDWYNDPKGFVMAVENRIKEKNR